MELQEGSPQVQETTVLQPKIRMDKRMDREQEADAILKALSQDCRTTLDQVNPDLAKDVKRVGPLKLKDGTICVLVAIDNRNIITSKLPLSPRQQEEAKVKAKELTGNSKTVFLRGSNF